MSFTEEKKYTNKELLGRFSPYLFKYKKLLIFDLFDKAVKDLKPYTYTIILDNSNKLKEKFEETNGDPWVEARNEFDYSQDDVVDVLVDMGIMSEEAARNWCEKAFTPYNISIEEFAKRVKEYIDNQGG